MLAFLGSGLAQICGKVVCVRIETLSNTNLSASKKMKQERASLPVDVDVDVAQKAPLHNFLILL